MNLCYFFGLCFALVTPATRDVVVKLSHGGKVRGVVWKSKAGKEYYAFRGIPYAEAPIGDRRFMAPITKKGWQGEFDATRDGADCLQFEPNYGKMLGREDCLSVNVYTPKFRTQTKRPVMFYIHGGAFAFGSGSATLYGPGRLMDSGVLLVSVNYRVDAFGFLSTGDAASPGNYGLMDQAMALKWVHDNIDAFGGDSKRVTIFGQSAGAWSVGYHLLSSMSTGLFHRAVSMSGSPLCTILFEENPLAWAQKLATSLGCPTNISTELVECLRNFPATDIIAAVTVMGSTTLFNIPFKPTLDGTFIASLPKELLTSGAIINRVPLLSGVTKDEPAAAIAGVMKKYPLVPLNSEFVISLVISTLITGEIAEAHEMIKNKYFSTADWDDEVEIRTILMGLLSDALMRTCTYENIDLFAKANIPAFAYSFDYSSAFNMQAVYTGRKDEEKWGVSHNEDLAMIFDGPNYDSVNFTNRDLKVMKNMLALWTNFAKHGNPSVGATNLPRWPRSSPNLLQIYHIDDPMTIESRALIENDLHHFWAVQIPAVLGPHSHSFIRKR